MDANTILDDGTRASMREVAPHCATDSDNRLALLGVQERGARSSQSVRIRPVLRAGKRNPAPVSVQFAR
jgi:hypothetical protein